MSPKPTILLIHGGWQFPTHYSKLTSALRTLGYEVHTPALPTMNGSRPPNADLATDTAFIRSYTTDLVDAGQTVVAIMHSYGGQVGSNALAGLGVADRQRAGAKGGVAHLIYMSSFALPEGKSVVGFAEDFGKGDMLPSACDFADDGTCVHRDPRAAFLGSEVSDAEAAEFISSLGRMNGKVMYQKIEKSAWKDEGVRVSYILTKADMALPYEFQKILVEGVQKSGKEVKCLELETGHSPFLTKPQEVADFVDSAVKS